MDTWKAPGFNDLYYGYLFALDDDAEEHVAMGWGSHNPSFIPQVRNTATWQKNPYLQTNTGEDSEDKTVEKLYAHIAYVNTIMSTLEEFPEAYLGGMSVLASGLLPDVE